MKKTKCVLEIFNDEASLPEVLPSPPVSVTHHTDAKGRDHRTLFNNPCPYLGVAVLPGAFCSADTTDAVEDVNWLVVETRATEVADDDGGCCCWPVFSTALPSEGAALGAGVVTGGGALLTTAAGTTLGSVFTAGITGEDPDEKRKCLDQSQFTHNRKGT